MGWLGGQRENRKKKKKKKKEAKKPSIDDEKNQNQKLGSWFVSSVTSELLLPVFDYVCVCVCYV